MNLVLSLFPGAGLLDAAFESEGFCVVKGPDLLWGGDVRNFHPPTGRFDGVIGGDPCQSHSMLANLVRAKGLQPRFPDMTPEYRRVIEEAQPAWFLRENVPAAPDIEPEGYGATSFLLCNSWLDSGDSMGEEQMRRRRFWFGLNGNPAPNLMDFIQLAALQLPMRSQTVTHRNEAAPAMIGSNGKVKSSYRGSRVPAISHTGRAAECIYDRGGALKKKYRTPAVLGRHDGAVGAPCVDRSVRYTLEEMLRLQGFPKDFFGGECPFTMQAKKKMIGNGVAFSTGVALARAVKQALGIEAAE